jgi:WD40 repeat protein
MTHARRRWPKPAFNVLAAMVVLFHGRPSVSAEPSGILLPDKVLALDGALVGPLAFAPDGKTIGGFGMEWFDDYSLPSALRIWAVDSGKKIADVSVPNAHIISFAFGHDSQRLFSGSWEGTVRVHDLRSFKTEPIPGLLGQFVTISPEGTRLAASCLNRVEMLDLASKTITVTRDLDPTMPINSSRIDTQEIQFSPTGKLIAVRRDDRRLIKVYEIELWDAQNLRSIAVLRADTSVFRTMRFAPDGAILATAGDDGTIVLWDVNAAKQRRAANVLADPRTHGSLHLAFSPDGKLLAVGALQAALLLWTETLEVIDTVKCSGGVGVEFSPDGKLLLINSASRTGEHAVVESKLWKVGKH